MLAESAEAPCSGHLEELTLRVLKAAHERRLSIAAAESCTGGQFASLLTNVEGYGHVFDCGLVTYSEMSKRVLLGLSAECLAAYGPVSEWAVKDMLVGLSAHCSADIIVAVTGFAGPGAPGEESGLVFMGAGRRFRAPLIKRHRYRSDDRGVVRELAIRDMFDLTLAVIEDRGLAEPPLPESDEGRTVS